MSCPAANSIVKLNVSMGSLPEGFCPATLQELGNAIAARLIVTPNQANSTFASGSIEPPNNQGPWFKNCNELFVWDDATARYVPITKGGFTKAQVFDGSGSFVVPDNIYYLMVEAWGAGGGGANAAGGQNGGGGGSGGYGLQFFPVTPTQSIAVTIGAGGANGASGVAGGTTTFSTLSVTGGAGAAADTGIAWSNGGTGGVASGALISVAGGMGLGGVSGTGIGVGADAPNGGGGGMANLNFALVAGHAPGGGGGGGVQNGLTGGLLPPSGGSGAAGRVIVHW